MKPLNLTMHGVGSFRDEVSVDFDQLNSPVAVIGVFGSGKTFLTEGVMVALYGKAVWYTGSIYDLMTQDGCGEAEITLAFEHEGEIYLIHRTITSSSHKARIHLGNGEMIAGPKVGDVANWVDTHIGTWETSASTWFLSQSRANDLCGQPGEANLVARRRAAFNELLGVQDLDEVADKMRSERTVTLARIKDLEALIAAEDMTENIDRVKESLSAHRRELLAVEAEIVETETLAKEQRERASSLSAVLQEAVHEKALGELEADRLSAVIKKVEEAWDRVSVLEGRETSLHTAKHDVSMLEIQKAEYNDLSPSLEVRENWEKHRDLYERYLEREEARGKRLEALSMSLPTIGAYDLAARVEEFDEDIRKLREENDIALEHNGNIEDRRRELEDELMLARKELQRLSELVRPETPFGDKCTPCPLLKEFYDPARKAAVTAQINTVRDNLALLPDLLPLKGDNGEMQRQVEAREARSQCERAKSTLAEIEAAKTPSYDAVLPPSTEPSDPRKRLGELDAAIRELAGAPARLESYHQAAKDLAEAREKAAEAVVAADEARVQQISVEQDMQMLVRKASEARADKDVAIREVAVSEDKRAKLHQSASELHGNIGRQEAALETAQRHAQVQAERQVTVKQLTDKANVLDDLTACFGPKGVRQILIDASAPELEEIADQLFEVATEGRMRLRISTQKALKGGGTAEDFGIMIKDARGERDATEHSGGELQLISILFRVSVSLWIARLKGVQPGCLFLDEAFDRLGVDGAQDLLRVLDSLSDRIGLIAVVTHDHQIADRLQSQIRVVKNSTGATVV